MAITLEEFLEKSNAEVCGDRLIVGVMADRRVVGDIIDGTFNLNDAGKELVESFDKAKEDEKADAAKDDASTAAKPAKKR